MKILVNKSNTLIFLQYYYGRLYLDFLNDFEPSLWSKSFTYRSKTVKNSDFIKKILVKNIIVREIYLFEKYKCLNQKEDLPLKDPRLGCEVYFIIFNRP